MPLYLVHMYHQENVITTMKKGVFLWDFAAGITLCKGGSGSVNFSKIDENRYEVHITNNSYENCNCKKNFTHDEDTIF